MYSALVFFGTLMMLSVGYAVLSSGLSNADKVGSGSGLTATSWNNIIDGIFELDTRTANIFSSGGNVGIGTNNPIKPLDIIGGANIYTAGIMNTATAGSSYGLFIAAGGNTTDYTMRLRARDNNTEYFSVRGDGNVGIGTVSPGYKLELASSATSWTTSPSIVFSDTTGLVDSRRWLVGNAATDYGSFNIAVSTTNSDLPINPKFTITKIGNVGIGTTSPNELLQINGAIKATRNIGNGSAIAKASSAEAYMIVVSMNYDIGNAVRSAIYHVLLNNEGTAVAYQTAVSTHNAQSATFSVSGGNIIINGLPAGNNHVGVFAN